MWAATMLLVMSVASIVMTMVNLQSPVSQCSDNSPLPLYFYNNCTEFLCCKVSGDSLAVYIDFTTTQPATSLYLQLRAVSSNDTDTVKGYPAPESDACQSLVNSSCPLDAGQTVKYRSSYTLPPFAQQTVNFAEYRMVNQNNETQACFVSVVEVLRPGETCGQTCN